MELGLAGALGGLRLLAVGLALFLVPGWFLQALTLRRDDLPALARIPISFAFSVGSLALLGVACYATKLPLEACQTLFVLWTVALFGVWLLQLRRGRISLASSFGPANRSDSPWPAILVACFALGCAVAASYGGVWLSDKSDGFYHLAAIRRQIDTGQVLSQGVFYAFQPDRLDPITGTWHLALAVLSMGSGVDITWLWIRLPVVLGPLLVLALYAFAERLFRRPWLALLCTVLQYGLYDKLDFRNAVYSNQIAYVLLWVAFVLTFSYLESGGWTHLALIMASAVVMVSWHLLLPEMFFVSLGAYLLVRVLALLLTRQPLRADVDLRRLFAILAPVLAVGASLLAFRAFKAHLLDVNAWTSLVSRVPTFRATLRLGHGLSMINPAGLYIVDPRWRFAPYRFAVWLLAYLALPFIIPACLKRLRFALFLFAIMAVVPAVLFNPILISVLQAKIPDIAIIRLVLLPPYGVMLGWFFWEFVRLWWRWIGALPPLSEWVRRGAWRRALGLVAAGGVVALAGCVLIRQGADNLYDLYSPASTHHYSVTASRRDMRTSDEPRYAFFFRAAAPDAVVATDPENGYYLGGLTGRSVIAVLQGHYPPLGIPTHRDRRDDSVRILDADYSMDSTIKLLDSYRVCYVWLDAHMKLLEKPLDPVATRRKLDARPDLFRAVYDDPDTTVYTYANGPAGCVQ